MEPSPEVEIPQEKILKSNNSLLENSNFMRLNTLHHVDISKLDSEDQKANLFYINPLGGTKQEDGITNLQQSIDKIKKSRFYSLDEVESSRKTSDAL